MDQHRKWCILPQGFHRYSTDELWHVPHFEKMLCDQAQLACVYLDTYQVSLTLQLLVQIVSIDCEVDGLNRNGTGQISHERRVPCLLMNY